MRTCLVLLFTALISQNATAQPGQVPQPPRADLSKLSSIEGAITMRDISDIGDLKTMKVQLVKSGSVANKDQQNRSVRFVYNYKDINMPDVKAVYVDAASLEELSRNFNDLQTKVFPQKSSNYAEASFKTRDGIIGGCYWAKGTWMVYMRLSEKDENSYVFIDREDFGKLTSLLDQAKAKLTAAPGK